MIKKTLPTLPDDYLRAFLFGAFAAFVIGMVCTLVGCCPNCPGPMSDAGTQSDAAHVEDAPEADAPYVCVYPESCPPGCNPTPCGCATDNPAIDCTP